MLFNCWICGDNLVFTLINIDIKNTGTHMCVLIHTRIYMSVCTCLYIYEISQFFTCQARSCLPTSLKRFIPLLCIQLHMCIHPSNPAFPDQLWRPVRTPAAGTVLYKQEYLNTALDLCYYQLNHRYSLLVPFKFASCGPFGGHVYVGAKALILLSIT